MDTNYPPGGLDLNAPADDDGTEQNVKLVGQGGHCQELAQVSESNTGPYADTIVETEHMLSSEESGSNYEVQSTPSSQTDIQKPYPDMIFESIHM